jgi:hypothetical protein
MEIGKLIERKEQLDRNLHTFIREELEAFRRDTGFSPDAVHVSMREITGLTDRFPRYMVDNVETYLGLKGVVL